MRYLAATLSEADTDGYLDMLRADRDSDITGRSECLTDRIGLPACGPGDHLSPILLREGEDAPGLQRHVAHGADLQRLYQHLGENTAEHAVALEQQPKLPMVC